MSDAPLADPQDETATPAAAATAADWTAAMEAATEEEGYFHSLGGQHSAFFYDQGTTLLVSFDTAAAIRARKGNLPLMQAIAARHGWSHLCLIADGATWFRDKAVYAFFDRQVDDAFFEDFDQVLFYGAGMGGYAACAYSVAAPGAQVLALNPRATLDPAQASWDRRDLAARRLDFTTRYGYAPDMLEGAAHVTVVHDPTLPVEAMHAALFRAPYITRLSAHHVGDAAEAHFTQTAILSDLVELAMAGKLDQGRFARLWRARRSSTSYLNALIDKTIASGRSKQEIMIYRSATQRLRVPRFARRLAKLTGAPALEPATADSPDKSVSGSD
jgi:hypothetical protein